jgi:hypothetical protein
VTRRTLAIGILVAAVWIPVACKPAVRGNGKNLLLVTLETTRADHLGTYGYFGTSAGPPRGSTASRPPARSSSATPPSRRAPTLPWRR